MATISSSFPLALSSMKRLPGILSLIVLLAACSNSEAPSVQQRWYSSEQVARGDKLFQIHCIECHGKQGEGAANWQKVGADGKYPPPPLNGSGHAWHHPMTVLFQVIKHGSPAKQGNMPAWQEKLNDQEIVAIVAWFQSQWPDTIYQAWQRRNPPNQ